MSSSNPRFGLAAWTESVGFKRGLILPAFICLATVVVILIAPSAAAEQWELGLFLSSFLLVAVSGATIGTRDLMNPYYSALLLYSLYSCSAIANVVLNEPGSYDNFAKHTYYLAVLVGLVGLIAGYYFVSRKSRLAARCLDRRFAMNPRKFGAMLLALTTLIVLLEFPTFLHWQGVQAYTDYALNVRDQYRAGTWGGIVSYAQGLSATMAFGAAYFFLIRRRSWLVRAGVIFGVVVYLLLTVMAGHKRQVLCASLLFLYFMHYRVRAIKLRQLLVPMMIIYVFAVMINHVRFTTNIAEMTSVGFEMLQDNPKLLLPNYAGELNGPPITLLDIIEAKESGQMEFSWGYTELTELLVWIPRGLFPDRPLPLSEQYMQLFFPDDYEHGAGHGFFIPTEGYWAWGVMGVFIVMFIYGAAIGAVYRVFQANLENDVVLMIYGITVFTLVFMGTRTGLLSTFKGALMDAGPFIILGWMAQDKGNRTADAYPSSRPQTLLNREAF